MLWKGRRQSDNIEDRRGDGGGFPGGFGGDDGPGGGFRIPIGRTAGGGGISGIIILIVLFFVLKAIGVDPMQILGQGDLTGGQRGQTMSSNQPAANDEMKQFVATVLAETEDTWSGIFKSQGLTYQDPTLVLFSGYTQSACGTAQRAMGPFYCPNDRKVYLDTAFFRQLSQQFHASGDFAQAYVIAHEVGHHVQNLIGILPKFNQMRQSMSKTQANAMSVRVELQADCFAGIWAHFTEQKGILEKGDVDEALNAASQIGDDTLQKETQGYVVPDSFTHGTSAERKHWFQTGYQSGKLSACDTFNNPI
ncbi:MAG TPA: neutral zinc metallopeptidase [Rhizobiaceae bacterium]|nr:neutral zinc metallopeptidase [Rhizobiaceae bacterium]